MASKPTYPWGMDKMDGVLALVMPEEIADALRFVDVWKKAGHMSVEESARWREKIQAWERFRLRKNPQLTRSRDDLDVPIVEEPAPPLPWEKTGQKD